MKAYSATNRTSHTYTITRFVNNESLRGDESNLATYVITTTANREYAKESHNHGAKMKKKKGGGGSPPKNIQPLPSVHLPLPPH